MNAWSSRFSIQYKLFFGLGLGFAGFLTYFFATFAITRQNQELMNAMVTERLPILEATEVLGQSLARMKNIIIQSAIHGNTDGLSALETANHDVQRALAEIGRLENNTIPEFAEVRKRYSDAHAGTSEALQNVVVGIEKLAAVQGKLQSYSAELSSLEKWSADLKLKHNAEFRAAVDRANIGGQRAMWAGFVLIAGALPFAVFFYLLTRGVTDGLRQVSGQLTEVSQNVLQTSSEASASSAKLASSATQQSTAVIESVSSMEQMKSMLGQTVRNSADALRSSEESFREAADGKTVIDSLRVAMLDIERSYEQLEEVNQVVRMIRDKTNIINDIVFKTQLLSFNASIEAARAGQHGRGFAVVAAEVGKLAEMSGKSANDIGKLLDQSARKVAEIVGSTKSKVESANKMSQRCATVFERITERAGQVKTMVNSITSAASEQEAGIHLVVRAMSEMRDSAGQTDNMAHVISNLSGTLRGHSQALAATVDRLEMLVHGAQDRDGGPGRSYPSVRPATKPASPPADSKAA